MRAGVCTSPFNLMSKGLAILMTIGLSSAQETPLSEIFFLDLGIVIEPAKGSETYSRVVNKPSKEVSFKIKKVESGSVYMASSEALLSTLGRINNRIEKLENSFQSEMNALQQENLELRQTLAFIQSVLPKAPVVMSSKEFPEDIVEDIPKINAPTEIVVAKPAPKFDQSIYMAGVFAYQREDFKSAIQKFSTLTLESAPQKTGENVLYWMADAYQQLGDYEKALSLLDQITISGTIRNDDALVQKGLLHRRMGNEPLAQLAFSNVVSRHPESEYYRLAKMELKKSDDIK